MAKRHADAIAIQQGACNPSGIAHSIVDACREVRDEPEYRQRGTEAVCKDPAVRLMVHQLAAVCGLEFGYHDLSDYEKDIRACLDQRTADQQAKYRAADNAFNRANYPDQIGKTFVNPPGYVAVEDI